MPGQETASRQASHFYSGFNKIVGFFEDLCFFFFFCIFEVPGGGRLEEELNFLSHVEERSSGEAGRETGLGGAYQVFIFIFWNSIKDR